MVVRSRPFFTSLSTKPTKRSRSDFTRCITSSPFTVTLLFIQVHTERVGVQRVIAGFGRCNQKLGRHAAHAGTGGAEHMALNQAKHYRCVVARRGMRLMPAVPPPITTTSAWIFHGFFLSCQAVSDGLFVFAMAALANGNVKKYLLKRVIQAAPVNCDKHCLNNPLRLLRRAT